VTVVNRGIPGYTTNDAVNKWTDNINADLTIIMLGINDSSLVNGSPRVSISDYVSNMQTLCERFIDFGSTVIILKHTRVGMDIVDYGFSYRKALEKVGSLYSIPIVNTQDFLYGYAESDLFGGYNNGDLAHMITFGYSRLASGIFSVIANGETKTDSVINDGVQIGLNATKTNIITDGNLTPNSQSQSGITTRKKSYNLILC
jgi:lysophospholipase L1-like esterase